MLPMTQPASAIKIICGLGNPETVAPRESLHNIGFFAVDSYALDTATLPAWELVDDALVCEIAHPHGTLLLAKPLFQDINFSGVPIRKLLDRHRLEPAELAVIHDDLDLALGRIKITRADDSPRHNGVRSVKAELSESKFIQIKGGIGRPPAGTPTLEWVKGAFPESMTSAVRELSEKLGAAARTLKDLGLEAAQRIIHS